MTRRTSIGGAFGLASVALAAASGHISPDLWVAYLTAMHPTKHKKQKIKKRKTQSRKE